MAGEKIPREIMKPVSEQEPIVEGVKQTKWNQTTYLPEYAGKVYNLLANSRTAKNKSHACAALKCSRFTLEAWIKKYPEFGDAVRNGLEVGKSKWMSRIAKHAYNPTAEVNNGLIKLLSSNVYGINEETEATLNINGDINLDAERLLKERGIPLPDIGVEDIEEKEE
jgi:hypothetical protein